MYAGMIDWVAGLTQPVIQSPLTALSRAEHHSLSSALQPENRAKARCENKRIGRKPGNQKKTAGQLFLLFVVAGGFLSDFFRKIRRRLARLINNESEHLRYRNLHFRSPAV
jgi:hypothetical protein